MASVKDYMLPLIKRDGHIRTMAEVEAELIDLALNMYPCRSECARRLGIARSTFYRKLENLLH